MDGMQWKIQCATREIPVCAHPVRATLAYKDIEQFFNGQLRIEMLSNNSLSTEDGRL